MDKDTRFKPTVGGSDGPTSVAVIKKTSKLTFKQKVQKIRYKIKRSCVERKIKPESHSMDEVMEYIINKHDFVELDKSMVEQEYKEMRTSLLMQQAADLLGEYGIMPQLKSESREDIQAYLQKFQEIKQRAMDIPTTEFDIDFHKFQRIYEGDEKDMYITIEKRFSYIGGGVSGNKKMVKRFQRIYKDIHKFYGVTREDIENKSKRYEQLVRALTR